MPTFEIVCLAVSRKRQGRCVAGLRTDGKGWLRPVGSNPEGVLFPHHYMLPDDTEPQLGDVLRVHCSRPNPQPHHPEDWVVLPLAWERVSRATEKDRRDWLRQYLVPGPPLFGSTGDRIAQARLQSHPVDSSLCLVAPQTMKWHIALNKEGERRTRVVFSLAGAQYSLPLTDPAWEQRLLHLKPGLHERETARVDVETELWLTLSLGEPFTAEEQDEAFCYKLVAGVLEWTPNAGLSPKKLGQVQNSKVPGQAVVRSRPKSSAPETAYASALDLSAYPDPFAEDAPVATVTEGRPAAPVMTISVPTSPASTPEHKTVPAALDTSHATESARNASALPVGPPPVPRQPGRKKSKAQAQAETEPPPPSKTKNYGKTNGKWDNPQDQSLWQQQKTRMRHVAIASASEWTDDEDALLQRLVADGEEIADIAAQLGRPLKMVSARLQALNAGIEE